MMKTGRATLRNGGGSAASFIRYYVVDSLDNENVSYRQLSVDSNAPDKILEGFDEYTETRWEPQVSGEISEVFAGLYADILGGNDVEDADRLYICVHTPLYKAGSIEALKIVYSTFLHLRMPMTMMFMGYGDDLAKVIEPSFEIESGSANQMRQFMKMKKAQEISVSTHMFVIQNKFSNGIPLKLDQTSLAEVMSLFAVVSAGYYKQIFLPTLSYLDIISFGISALYLDRHLYVDYMLNKVLLQAIDKSKMMVSKVSVNDAFDRAMEIVRGKDEVLSTLLAEYDQGEHQNYQQTANMLAEQAETIVRTAEDIFERDNDVTMQAATLAALLSKNECELFTNIIYDPQKSSTNDLLVEPIDYFISQDVTGFYSEEGNPITNPIPRIKELDSLIINSEAEIRHLQEELDTYEAQIDDVSKMGDATFEENCIVVNNKKYRLLPAKEEELQKETYVPSQVAATSVDLTAEFRPIQNQGSQGSCVAFSLTSVFEYAVKLNTGEMKDLSEAFLYYNSRKLDQGEAFDPNLDEGTTITSALKSLAEFGLPEETYCRYNEYVCSETPSQAAYDDAMVRKLIKALNVERRVEDIKSAVAEGYPVLGSFSLCPSFNPSSNGLVSMPSQEEIAAIADGTENMDKHNRHAMVIVGFDDRLQSFLVRNSWGADWGSKGYCYIPYDYISNQYLFNYACIIKEIQSLPIVNIRKVVEMRVDDTDINIRRHICKIAKGKEEARLATYRNERTLLCVELEELKRDFTNPNKSQHFIDVTCQRKEIEKENLIQSKKDLARMLDTENDHYRLFKKRTWIMIVMIPILFCLGVLYNNYLADEVTYMSKDREVTAPFLHYFVHECIDGNPQYLSFAQLVAGYGALAILAPVSLLTGDLALDVHFLRMREVGIMKVIPIAGLLVLVLILIGRARWNEWRSSVARLEQAIVKKSKEIAEKQTEIDNFKAKTHYAREWLRLLGEVQNRFQQRYTKLICLICNMREKYRSLKEYDKTVSLDLEMPYTSLLDKDRLDKYFEEHLSDDEVCEVKFCQDIENYRIDEDYVQQYIRRLTQIIQQRMAEHEDIAEFRIHDHIARNTGEKIAKPVKNLIKVGDDEISMPNLQRRSEHFIHTNSVTRGVVPELSYIFMPEGGDADFIIDNQYLAVYMKVACLECDECVMFQKKDKK